MVVDDDPIFARTAGGNEFVLVVARITHAEIFKRFFGHHATPFVGLGTFTNEVNPIFTAIDKTGIAITRGVSTIIACDHTQKTSQNDDGQYAFHISSQKGDVMTKKRDIRFGVNPYFLMSLG